MNSSPFNWSKLITAMSDETRGIPTDVTFQIVEKGQLHEIKAHKMLLAMVSDTFQTMFYSTDVGDKTDNVIKVDKTTAPAFRIMMDGVYNTKSIRESFEGKSVDEVFDVVNLLERYHITELMEAAKECLANYPVSDNTVLEVDEDAMEYTKMFEAEANQLLHICSKYLAGKLKDVKSIVRYVVKNEDRKDVFFTLLARMDAIIPATECINCRKEICKDGDPVEEDEFREGLVVKQNNAVGYWGTGRVIKVTERRVTNIESIKPGLTQNGFIGAKFTSTDDHPMYYPPYFLFSCKIVI